MTIVLPKFRLKIAEHKKRPSKGYTKIGKIVRGVVIEENDVLKVKVEFENESKFMEVHTFNFTPRSFEIEGRVNVFTKAKDKFGKRVRLCRDLWKAKFHPGSTDNYLPFNVNWIVKGYIVTDGLLRWFDFKDLVSINGYDIKDIS
ncbi:MAG: hypothetical protein IJG68_01700 [Bacilli bacterium]|nr:hypothetical protein [Bacilli bacterium]